MLEATAKLRRHEAARRPTKNNDAHKTRIYGKKRRGSERGGWLIDDTAIKPPVAGTEQR
jgi:hypothetical protein